MKESWGIRVVLRKDKMRDGGRCPLHWEVTVNGQVSKFSTGKGIELKHWDNLKKEAKKGCGYSMVLNEYLYKTKTEFHGYMMGLENKGAPITKKKVKEFFRGEKKETFYGFFEKTVKMWVGDKKESTINSYWNTLKILKLMDPDIDFGDIDYGFVKRWENYLITVRGNATNGRINRHKCLKAVINEAILEGHMSSSPYVHFKIKREEAKKEFLSIEEVKRLMELELPIVHIRQQRTQDMFLFSCLTGLRFSDVLRLTWRNIKIDSDEREGLLVMKMQKTSKEIQMWLIEPVFDILKRYPRKGLDEPIFDPISNQAINRNLKVLMNLIGVDRRITFHCSRHTFASNHVELATSTFILKDLMGHANISQTQLYAKTLPKDLVDSMKQMAQAYR